jgi:membrane associated rhomboid family serine protease
VFIPIHDDTPHHVIRFQWVSGAFMLVNFLLFILTRFGLGGEAGELAVMNDYGMVPLLLTQSGAVPAALSQIPAPLTLVTYSFLHGGWGHLLTNLLFIWVFADNVEDAFGHASFALFYVLCAIGAAFAHAVVMPASGEPLVGASGAVAGILAAYLVLFPRARVWVLLFLRLPVRLPAWLLLAGWIAVQVAGLFMVQPTGVAVAWWAHIGGFATGLVLTVLLRGRLITQNRP